MVLFTTFGMSSVTCSLLIFDSELLSISSLAIVRADEFAARFVFLSFIASDYHHSNNWPVFFGKVLIPKALPR